MLQVCSQPIVCSKCRVRSALRAASLVVFRSATAGDTGDMQEVADVRARQRGSGVVYSREELFEGHEGDFPADGGRFRRLEGVRGRLGRLCRAR